VLVLLLGGAGYCGSVGVFLGEALDAAGGVNQFLLAGEERVAIRADFDTQHIAFDGRARGEGISAGAMDGYGVIVGVDTGFHGDAPLSRPVCTAPKGGDNSRVARSQAILYCTQSVKDYQIACIAGDA
jgi:hypothetical protein